MRIQGEIKAVSIQPQAAYGWVLMAGLGFNMKITEIQAKSILRKHKKIDSWFISHYGMNLYRGCIHNCIYCDGRAEKYQVKGEFGEDVAVKVNAIEILNRELDPKRKRKPFVPSFMMVGGGVGDSYQAVEKRYALTRQALELIHKYDFPTHILTKSTLVERDLDILKQINANKRALVSFSFSSVNDEISRFVEPGVPLPSERLETLKRFKSAGIACGMFLMPVIPFLTDGPQLIEKAVSLAKAVGLDYIIFSGMTLKAGQQKDHFIEQIRHLTVL
jgi:DNA repair photolyase